jgi:hypothetical protein
MTKFVVALIVVFALLVSGLLGLLRNRRVPMGSPEVLERARRRNEALDAEDRAADND